MSEEELIETLRAFEKNRVEQLEEPAKNLFYAIMKIADERDRLNNIINELENIIDIEMNKMGYAKYDSCLVLMKMKINELKGSDKNE